MDIIHRNDAVKCIEDLETIGILTWDSMSGDLGFSLPGGPEGRING